MEIINQCFKIFSTHCNEGSFSSDDDIILSRVKYRNGTK